MYSGYEDDISNYNKVKEIVLKRLVEENLLDEYDAEEFSERCQIMVYKGKWWQKWFTKNVSQDKEDINKYFIRIIELKEREDDVDRLLRRTTSSYDE